MPDSFAPPKGTSAMVTRCWFTQAVPTSSRAAICVRAREVPAPYRTGEAEARVVGAGDGVVHVREFQHRKHRPELFLRHEPVGFRPGPSPSVGATK